MKFNKMINQVIQGDCLEIMKDIPDNSIDLVVTDPPYGIDLKYDVYEDTDENWDKMFLNLIPELKRISKMVIMPCCQIKKLPMIYKHYPPDWLICWYKGSPGHRAYIGFNDWEPHLVYGKNDGVQMHDYFRTPITEKKGNYEHPCPKPIEWAKWLISRASKENDLILDPFLGSGTTAVACQNLKRRFIGIEISKEYCEIAKQRLRQQTLL